MALMQQLLSMRTEKARARRLLLLLLLVLARPLQSSPKRQRLQLPPLLSPRPRSPPRNSASASRPRTPPLLSTRR